MFDWDYTGWPNLLALGGCDGVLNFTMITHVEHEYRLINLKANLLVEIKTIKHVQHQHGSSYLNKIKNLPCLLD